LHGMVEAELTAGPGLSSTPPIRSSRATVMDERHLVGVGL